jgi:hypothetical protein
MKKYVCVCVWVSLVIHFHTVASTWIKFGKIVDSMALGRFPTFETRPKLGEALQTLSCSLLDIGFALVYCDSSRSAILTKTKDRFAFF